MVVPAAIHAWRLLVTCQQLAQAHRGDERSLLMQRLVEPATSPQAGRHPWEDARRHLPQFVQQHGVLTG